MGNNSSIEKKFEKLKENYLVEKIESASDLGLSLCNSGIYYFEINDMEFVF